QPSTRIPMRPSQPLSPGEQQPARLGATAVPLESFAAGVANTLPPSRRAGTQVNEPGAIPATAQAGAVHELDWDARFSAIQSRLRQCVGERLDFTPLAVGDLVGLNRSLVQAIVLDCVEGLEQLHQSLRLQRGPVQDELADAAGRGDLLAPPPQT
ncbi:MAG: hypothetical protein ABIP46_12140, partial [Polaromonas sp.]